jgi:hypothetical protein
MSGTARSPSTTRNNRMDQFVSAASPSAPSIPDHAENDPVVALTTIVWAGRRVRYRVNLAHVRSPTLEQTERLPESSPPEQALRNDRAHGAVRRAWSW